MESTQPSLQRLLLLFYYFYRFMIKKFEVVSDSNVVNFGEILYILELELEGWQSYHGDSETFLGGESSLVDKFELRHFLIRPVDYDQVGSKDTSTGVVTSQMNWGISTTNDKFIQYYDILYDNIHIWVTMM